jgi:hypothetical protein
VHAVKSSQPAARSAAGFCDDGDADDSIASHTVDEAIVDHAVECQFCVEAQVGYEHGTAQNHYDGESWHTALMRVTGVWRPLGGLTLGGSVAYQYMNYSARVSSYPEPRSVRPEAYARSASVFVGFVFGRGTAVEQGPRLGLGWTGFVGGHDYDQGSFSRVDFRYWIGGSITERWSIVGELGPSFATSGTFLSAQLAASIGVAFALDTRTIALDAPEPPKPAPRPPPKGTYLPLPTDTWP